ncbi:MAG: KH domain-containing protein [Eggerthellaceae bacterium]|nr:KH domain-containing protein [Eggerthellaceae bacterium]
MSEPNDIAGLVDCVVRPLVDYEEDLQITSREEDGAVLIEISVNEEDTGKIIGRQGRVIKAIRTLVRAAASRNDMRVEVEILD